MFQNSGAGTAAYLMIKLNYALGLTRIAAYSSIPDMLNDAIENL